MLFGKLILINLCSALSTLGSDATHALSQNGQHIAPKIGLCLAGTFILGTLCFANDQTLGVLKGGFQAFTTPRPATDEEWDKRKIELRKTLRRLLGDLPPLFTVDCTGRDKNHTPYTHIAHRLHQADRSAHVGGIVLARVKHRFRYGNPRSKMVDAINILKQRPQLGSIVHISPRK